MDPARSPSTSTDAPRTRCTTARVRNSLQHPRVVAEDDGLDLARAEMTRSPHGAAQSEREARDVRDLPETVAVLEQEGLAVDLDELAAIRRRRGHAASLSEREGQSGGRPGSPGSTTVGSLDAPPSSASAVDATPPRRAMAAMIARRTARRDRISTTLPIVGDHRRSLSCAAIMATEPIRSIR